MARKTWHMAQLAFSSNVYWNICVKICILKQIIATILFMCIFSMKSKRSMLRFQSTTAPLTEGVLPVFLVRKHPSQYFHTFPLVPTAHVAVKCETCMCRTHRLSWKLVSKHGGSWRIWEDEWIFKWRKHRFLRQRKTLQLSSINVFELKLLLVSKEFWKWTAKPLTL